MTKFAVLASVALFLCAAPIIAAEKTADYEVHEWGFVTINSPPDQHSLQSFLDSLPGNVRKPGGLIAIEQRPQAQGDAVQIQPGQNGPQNPGNSGGGPAGTPAQGTGAGPGSGSGQGSGQAWPGNGMPIIPPGSGDLGGIRFCDPFIWFHASRPVNFQLSVKLGKSLPLCWWPQGRDDGSTLIWDRVSLQAAPHGGKRMPDQGSRDSDFWKNIRSGRKVDSSYVCTGNKVEKFLMYEFAGSFQTGLKIARAGGSFTLSNTGFYPVQDLFLISDGKVFSASTLNPSQSSTMDSIREIGEFKPESFLALLGESLVQAGLNADEAAAMAGIMSSQSAFFASKGVKAIHLLSPRQINEIAKLEFSPEPREIKRVWLALVWDAENAKEEIQGR